MRIQKLIAHRRLRRKMSIRREIFGTPERYRLTVTRSLTNIYAQIINDVEGKTLVACSSLDKEVRSAIKPEMKKTEISKIVGLHLAKKALSSNVKDVAFDRNGYLYHGRVKALADGAREGGLVF